MESTKAFLKGWADKVVEQAQRELRASRRRWKYSYAKDRRGRVSQYRGSIENTGTLGRSLQAEQYDDGSIAFMMEEYGQWVDMGRRKGRGAPVNTIREWIRKKPLRLRDPETGEFKSTTEKGIRTAAYLINRKLKYFGIDATYFFTEPLEVAMGALQDGLTENMAADIEERVMWKIRQQGNMKIKRT